jgi:nitrous oxidase accessory protein NosD
MRTEFTLVALFAHALAAGCSSSDGAPATDPEITAFSYENEEVSLDSDLVVPSGEVGRIGPGVTLTATADVTIRVEGTLVIAATKASPARLVGAGTVDSWQGIVVEAGGKIDFEHVEMRDAKYGIHALAGSTFAVDYADISGGFKAAILESDGTFDHSHFAGAMPTSISFAAEVSIDDPNGTMTILSASPTVTNSVFVGASPFTDMVRIGGESKPTFDHVLLRDAHCGFHNFGAANNSPLVKNSIFENLSYGVMAFSTKPVFENNVFRNNQNDVGFCLGATADNAPVLSGNYYEAGNAAIDPGCVQIGTTEASAATAPIEGAGPAGL